MRGTAMSGRWTRGWACLATVGALALLAGACSPPPDGSGPAVGVTRQALTNAAGDFLATAETTAIGTRLNSTTYAQTQADDGLDEQLGEAKSKNIQILDHTFTLDSLTGAGSFTLVVKAKKLEGSGDTFTFGWSTSSAGPFTSFCTIGTADTAYKYCRQVITLTAGTTAIYVNVVDSIQSSDSTTNQLNVDLVALSNALCNGQAAGAVCRASAGACDAAETCDGASPVCPPDAKRPGGYVCRAAAGPCDLAETCDGSSNACPSDTKQPSTYVCRPSAGICDVDDRCDGTNAACPADVKIAAGAVCRAATGPCDTAETCNGAAAACPADVKAAAGTVCRTAAGECDAAEACDGATAACPADGFQASGTACTDDGNPCTADTCNGSGTCAHPAGNAGASCRAAAGPCDVTETCTGSSATCPADAKVAAGVICRDAAGDCDVAEACNGSSNTCPADGFKASTVVCRAAASGCDVAENCTGTAAACPADLFKAAGTACGDGKYCTVSDQCNGSGVCAGSPRDCSALTEGCMVGQCSEGTSQCLAEPDPAGDGNSCTTDDQCLPELGEWFAATNDCGGPEPFTAKVTADGIQLTWTNPTDPGLTAIEVYRTVPGTAVTKPGARPEAKIYRGLATSYLDAAAPAGPQVYTAFALYSGGWSAPRTASAQRDDQDGDGMPDGWELTYGLNPNNSGDADLDGDSDGLTNLQEYLHGSNPNVADTDGDGLTDGAEVRLGTDGTAQDTDGDGMADKFELGLGLDPLNSHDFAIGNYSYSQNFRLGAFVADSGQHLVDGTGQPLRKSETKQMIALSQQQASPIGVAGSPTGYGNLGYVYTIEELIAPNYPPRCDAGANIALSLPGTAPLSGSASDPNGDPISYSWTFWSKPTLSAVTNASISGATTATPSFTPDVYGYYGLMLTVTDVQGLAGAPCYVVVSAVNAGQFYVTGPFASLSPAYKMVSITTAAGGSLPLALASATKKAGLVIADRGPTSADALTGAAYRIQGRTPSAGQFKDGALGLLSTAFALYDMTTNVAPVANAGADQTVPFGHSVTLDGSRSNDPDAYPVALTYSWTVWQRPYGSTAAITGATSPVATLMPDKAGAYVALLTVSDGEITSVPAPVVITVANTVPMAKAGPDQYVDLVSPAPTVALDGSGSFDPEGKPLTYNWRFFRKPAGSTAALANATTATPTFVPDKAGYYHLELVVRDGFLVSAPDHLTIHVATSSGNLPPVAVAGGNQALVGANQTGLDGSGSYDPDWDQVAHPDPDASGVYRKGLGHDWAILTKPAGSTATIACMTAQSPAWDCPNPVLRFNGFNGTYVIGLTVIDAAAATSDQVTMTVTVSGIQDVPPVAVASPLSKMLDWSQARYALLDGSRSYDPVDGSATLAYTWTIVQQPAGTTPTLTGATTATPTLTLAQEGYYKVHLKVCDQGGKCSCAWGEQRAGDATCNRDSVVSVATSTARLRVGMPAGWPQVGQPGGSGAIMSLFMGDDGVYDKPVILTSGFTGFIAAAKGADGTFLQFKPIVKQLRSQGYDVWYLEFDPVCSGGATPNLNAPWAMGGQRFCATAGCACPYPQQPVDNHLSLSAVALASAVRQVKDYGACYGKSADDPTSPCFVRVIAHSMGATIARLALAWAQDSTQTTVPYAAGESAPYALNGLRAKPAGQNVWDLGARVFVSADGAHHGGNIPVAAQALVKGFEASSPSTMDSAMGFQTSGGGNLIAWAFLKHQGLRNFFIDQGQKNPGAGSSASQMIDMAVAGMSGIMGALINKVALGSLFGSLGTFASGFISGYLQGMVAGGNWALIGAVINGLVQWALQAVVSYVLQAIMEWYYSMCMASGPYGWVVAIVTFILDKLFGISKLFFSVSTKFETELMDDSTAEFSPFSMAPILDSPAAKELLYQSVSGYKTCAAAPMLLQGNSVANRWPRGFGKETHGRICNGTMQVTTTSATHDQFYAYLDGLNGGRGFPTNVRNLALTFGGPVPALAPDNHTLLELYLPYVVSNQSYPTTAYDHMAGSGFGTELEDAMLHFKMHLKGVLTITKRVLWHKSKKKKTLFDDKAYFPKGPVIAGSGWPFIPTESAADFRRPAGCGTNLPCCQMLPPGTTAHPQDDGQRNCCACTTRFDSVVMPKVNLLHAPELAVNPCFRGQNPEDPFIEGMRAACVAGDQSTVVRGVQEKMCLAFGDSTVYLRENTYGYSCGPDASERATREAAAVFAKGFAQLDTRPGCAATSATQVCLSGAATCGASEKTWVWTGGVDHDADGCPGQYGCASLCESDASDASYSQSVAGGAPLGNHAPVITAISPEQTFELPNCFADQTARSYSCLADVTTAARTALGLSVTATDQDGDPLTYSWSFEPDVAQDQPGGEVLFSSGSRRTPTVRVLTQDRAPQGRYLLRVTVRDNKGGETFAETAVVVPGDAPPAVSITSPDAVPEICEYEASEDEGDAWRCYADLLLQAAATDPDGPDQTSIILVRWEDITDRQTSGYRGVSMVDDWTALSPGLEVRASEDHATTPVGYPLKYRVTVVDTRGQQASAETSVIICPGSGC